MKADVESSARGGRDAVKLAYLQGVRRTQVDDGASERYHDFVKFIDATAASMPHYVRYCRTFRAMDDYFGAIEGKNIVETGSASPMLRYLSDKNTCKTTSTDLRLEINAPTGSVDLVFSFEVLEHLKDEPEKIFDEIVLFQGSGARNYAGEIYRILKPGGHLVLTTPNAASYRACQNLVDGNAPYVFRRHVREYSKSEIVENFLGLEPVHHETQFNFFYYNPSVQSDFEKKFKALGWPTVDRGDDHVFVFRKPAV